LNCLPDNINNKFLGLQQDCILAEGARTQSGDHYQFQYPPLRPEYRARLYRQQQSYGRPNRLIAEAIVDDGVRWKFDISRLGNVARELALGAPH